MKKGFVTFILLAAVTAGVRVVAAPVVSAVAANEMEIVSDFDLPYDSEVEWLESDGFCYIYSPISLTSENMVQGVNIHLTVAIPNGANLRGLLAQGPGMYSVPWAVACNSEAGTFKLFCNGVFQRNFSGATNKTDLFIEATDTTIYLTANGIRAGGAFPRTYPFGSQLSILGYDGTGSIGSPSAQPAPRGTRLYGYKMYIDDVLMTDLIPVRVGSGVNAVGYLYDDVSGELFGNNGIGAFVIGPDKDGGDER